MSLRDHQGRRADRLDARSSTKEAMTAVEELVVRITEHAIMELDADEENSLQINAFGEAVKREITLTLARQSINAQKRVEELEEALDDAADMLERVSGDRSHRLYNSEDFQSEVAGTAASARAVLDSATASGTPDIRAPAASRQR
jgi:hypothetical protein